MDHLKAQIAILHEMTTLGYFSLTAVLLDDDLNGFRRSFDIVVGSPLHQEQAKSSSFVRQVMPPSVVQDQPRMIPEEIESLMFELSVLCHQQKKFFQYPWKLL